MLQSRDDVVFCIRENIIPSVRLFANALLGLLYVALILVLFVNTAPVVVATIAFTTVFLLLQPDMVVMC